MIDLPETVTPPMKMDKHGAIHVSGTRVMLDTLIARYQQGDTPEVIHEGFQLSRWRTQNHALKPLPVNVAGLFLPSPAGGRRVGDGGKMSSPTPSFVTFPYTE